MFKANFLILEVTSGTYEGNDWAKIKARSHDVANNQIVSIKVDLKQVSLSELQDKLDTECGLTFSLFKGDKDSLVVKVVSVK